MLLMGALWLWPIVHPGPLGTAPEPEETESSSPPPVRRTPAPSSKPEPTPERSLARLAGLPEGVQANLPLHLPTSRTQAIPPALARLEATAKQEGEAASWRALADAAAQAHFHHLAEDAYRKEADIYMKSDRQAAQAERMKAAAHGASLNVSWLRDATHADRTALDTGARLEPATGCYLGAFIDRDDNIGMTLLDNRQMHGSILGFEQRVGRSHASYYTYLSYGTPFPRQWVASLKADGAIPHISWEPRDIASVRDDRYLEDFVAQARDADWPIFIRFACEMNGEWTRYHGHPREYIRAFRTVYTAFRKAPKAALIWCPDAQPAEGIDDYYPGDDYCDWVGVNLYNVMYLDDDKKRPGDSIHPTDLLDPIYQKYSARKPIAICEYAASHYSHLDPAPRPEFAVHRIEEFYTALQTSYPRVKMIDWYDCNNIVHARPGRQLNDYLLTDNPEVESAYRKATASSWFLGSSQDQSPTRFDTLSTTLPTDVVVRASLRSWTQTPHVYFVWDGKVVQATSDPSQSALCMQSKPGHHTLRVAAWDEENRPIADHTFRVTVR
jgi:hypothetical protein